MNKTLDDFNKALENPEIQAKLRKYVQEFKKNDPAKYQELQNVFKNMRPSLQNK